MSELQTAIIDPLKDFATKSIQLVKKCTKPNRKGASRPRRSAPPPSAALSRSRALPLTHARRLAPTLPFSCTRFTRRVHQNRQRHERRLLADGLHRLLRQAHPHPHQQHHRRRRLTCPLRRLSRRERKTGGRVCVAGSGMRFARRLVRGVRVGLLVRARQRCSLLAQGSTLAPAAERAGCLPA